MKFVDYLGKFPEWLKGKLGEYKGVVYSFALPQGSKSTSS
jgi:hypothetical protein